jgi:hypothetical protein
VVPFEGGRQGPGLGQSASDGDEEDADVVTQGRPATEQGRVGQFVEGEWLAMGVGSPLELGPPLGDHLLGEPGVHVHDAIIGALFDIFNDIWI